MDKVFKSKEFHRVTPPYLSTNIIVLLIFCVFLLPNSASHAQSINTTTESISLSEQYYITIDTEDSLTPETLAKQFENNIKGIQQTQQKMLLGSTDKKQFVAISIDNNSNISEWVLDFGSYFNGRSGTTAEISIYNHALKNKYSFGNETNRLNFETATPIKLKTNSKNLLILTFKGNGTLAYSISPQLLTYQAYIQKIKQPAPTEIIFFTALLLCIAYFFSAIYTHKDIRPTSFLGFNVLLVFLIITNDSIFLTDSIILTQAPNIIIAFAAICSLMNTKFFLELEFTENPLEILALIILAGFILMLPIGLILLGIQSNLNVIILMTFIILSQIICMTLAVLAGSKEPKYFYYYALSLLFSSLAFTLYMLSTTGMAFTGILANHTTWAVFIFSNIAAIYAHIEKYKAEKIKEKHRQKIRMEEQKKLIRLQKSKESSDQARLLRVIERERELMAELREREVKRTEEMRMAKDAANSANQAKSAFLAVVSHEIRTPMTGIMGMINLLNNTVLNKTQVDYLDTIERSGETMMALLNDILDFEKIESGAMSLETTQFDIRKLIGDIVTLMQGHAMQKNLTLKYEIDDTIPSILLGDPTRLRQILLNLVNNGLKFTHNGSVSIHISSQSAHKNSNFITFKVTDTGIGISEEGIKKLFTPFSQAETSTTRNYGGTGLGLAISSRLVDAMNGKIEVDSVQGQGTTFSFTIELTTLNNEYNHASNPRTDVAKQDTIVKIASKKMHILITDDNDINRKVICGLLDGHGHTLHQAANGLECLAFIENHPVDLILMDIEMPGLNGTETTNRIKNSLNKKISNIKIIALTGNVDKIFIESCFDIGMNDFIEKPVNPEKLYDAIFKISEEIIKTDISSSDSASTTSTAPQKLELDDSSHMKMNISDLKHENAPNLGNIKASSTAKADKKSISTLSQSKIATPIPKSDDGLSEIQRFLLAQKSPQPAAEPLTTHEVPLVEKTSTPLEHRDGQINNPENDVLKTDTVINVSTAKPEPEFESDIILLDYKTLDSLNNTLGKEKFLDLLENFRVKTDELVLALENAANEKNAHLISTRAHELRGMAGNFGLKGISDLAMEMEKFAKTNRVDEAVETSIKLSAINFKTKSALDTWIES